MAKLRGEDVIMGVGLEAGRGVQALPQMWIPGRTPSGVAPILEKTLIRETRGTKIATHASEIQQKRIEGDFEFNVRSESFGFFLKSLLGQAASGLAPGETDVYRHVFSVLLRNPQHPSLTLALSQPTTQDYAMPLSVVSNLELTAAPDDMVMATASFIGKTEVAKSPSYQPEFDPADVYFRQYELNVKIAADVAGLAAAPKLKLKGFSLSIPNNGRPDHNIGDLTPSDVLALMIEPTGNITMDLDGQVNHDIFITGAYRAMQIEMVREDITLGLGTNPKIVITLPKISFETYSPDRPLDDVVSEGIDFQAHYDDDEENAIEVEMFNERVDYNADEPSGS